VKIASGIGKETTMSRRKTFVALAVTAAVSALGAAGAAANSVDRTDYRGGFVIPGSPGGVNSAYHPHYFGNPPNYACLERFKSYDAASGTYLVNDDRRHPCKG
jgi:hypothetical protein